eukprot:470985-Hanusia_phi.AAC.1
MAVYHFIPLQVFTFLLFKQPRLYKSFSSPSQLLAAAPSRNSCAPAVTSSKDSPKLPHCQVGLPPVCFLSLAAIALASITLCISSFPSDSTLTAPVAGSPALSTSAEDGT